MVFSTILIALITQNLFPIKTGHNHASLYPQVLAWCYNTDQIR